MHSWKMPCKRNVSSLEETFIAWSREVAQKLGAVEDHKTFTKNEKDWQKKVTHKIALHMFDIRTLNCLYFNISFSKTIAN